jgi:hypothetical protein
MPVSHPVITQLRVTRGEFLRGLATEEAAPRGARGSRLDTSFGAVPNGAL